LGSLGRVLTAFRAFVILTHNHQSYRLRCDHSTIIHGRDQRVCMPCQQCLKIAMLPQYIGFRFGSDHLGISDRLNACGPFMVWGCVIAIVGYVIILAPKKLAIQYGGTFLATSGVNPGVAGWLSNKPSPSLCEGHWSWPPNRYC
jgi:hypothetical protein